MLAHSSGVAALPDLPDLPVRGPAEIRAFASGGKREEAAEQLGLDIATFNDWLAEARQMGFLASHE